jgi:DNA-binding transcriptional MerR regulator
MTMHIREFAELTGVSVRTLHYYDEIGLLKPCRVDEQTGYRSYDETSLERMQEILFYRELDFSLGSIAEILSSPDYDKQKALVRQRELLILKRDRLNRLIDALDNAAECAEKGEMNMAIFDNSDYEAAKKQYESEVKEKWGETEAYREHSTRTKGYTREQWAKVTAGMDAVFGKFAACRADGNAADSPAAQAVAAELQAFITANFYTCTKPILAGLGQMYVCDERFRANIDRHGEGTADYASEAIRAYCKG